MPLTLDWKEIAIRLALSVIAGGLIGLDRGEHGRPAGLRTTIDIAGSGERLQIVPGGPVPFADLTNEDPYVAQLRHFQESLASGAAFLVTREEVLRVMRVVAAARESAQSGQAVVLEPMQV